MINQQKGKVMRRGLAKQIPASGEKKMRKQDIDGDGWF